MHQRREIEAMSDVALQIAFDGAASRLASDWARNMPGRLSDVYDVALLHAEAAIRARPLAAPMPHGQLSLFDL